MKSSLLFLLFGLVLVSSHSTVEFDSRSLVLDAIENLRDKILNGDEELGIPVLDPFEAENANFNLDTSALKADFKSQGITINGLGGFEITQADLSMLKMTFTFEGIFPTLKLTADHYSLLGKLALFPIYGDGKLVAVAEQLDFSGSAKFSVGISGVRVRSLNLQLNLRGFKSETTGMLGGGDIDDVINEILKDFVPTFFNSNSEMISEILSEIFLERINDYLSNPRERFLKHISNSHINKIN